MHCINCGSYVVEGARYCASCGTTTNDPEATRIASHSRPDLILPRDDESTELERIIFTARPTLLFIKLGYVLAAIAAIGLTIVLAMLLPQISWYISLPLALALLLIPAWYHIKRNMIRYTLTDSKVEIDEGFIARSTRNIPLRNIQDVQVSMSIRQRLLGFGDIVIDNASEYGGTTVLRNIDKPRDRADLLLKELRRYGR